MSENSNIENNVETCATVRHSAPLRELTFVGSALLESTHKPMRDAALQVYERFLEIESQFLRDRIKHWVATDPALLRAEEAIDKQAKLALAGDEQAMERVVSGMDYWRKLICRKMDEMEKEAGIA
jgi:hypothetical protein